MGVKVHCLYDERDLQDQALDYATFIQRSDSILEVSYHTSRRIETYQYDAKGNRIEVSTTGIGEGTSETTTKAATYWPNTDRIKTYGAWTYVWDAAGNLTEKGTEYAEGVGFSMDTGLYVRYEYDLWNRMTAVHKGEAGTASANLAATYAYGPDDIRVSKVSAATGGTAWLHDLAGRVLHEEGADYARDYVWAEGALLGYEEERDTDGDGTRERFRRYILTDHLGSAIGVLDEAGNLLSTTDYSAFGESGDVSPILAPIYTGKQWDADAGLYYFNARWYDPELGRFTTEDPIKDGGNWYAYVGNRPLVATDPTGLAGPAKEMDSWEWRAAIAYNMSHGYIAAEFLPNSVLTQKFRNVPEKPGIPLNTKEGKTMKIEGSQVYLNYIHSGEDRKIFPAKAGEKAEGGYVSPGYYRVVEIDTEKFLLVLERIGTDSHEVLRHLDPKDLEKIKLDTVFKPGESIIPYPKEEFGTSGGIHGHIEETRIGENGLRVFVSPTTHDLSTSLRSEDTGATKSYTKTIKTDDGEREETVEFLAWESITAR